MPKLTVNSPMNLTQTCPNCGAVAKCRSTREVTPTYREAVFECRALECGMAWKSSIALIHVIRPSGAPRAGLALPVLKRPANDSGAEVPLPVPANDVGEVAAAL